MSLVTARYHLPRDFKESLAERPVPWGFGLLSEAVYYRTYSRDGENWAGTVCRVVEGVMSIRKDWYVERLGKWWDAEKWDAVAKTMATAMFEMRFLPPGRGLWAMGTEFCYERGSHALNNCGYVSVNGKLSDAAGWLMDSLMCGVGVGFGVAGTTFPVSPVNDKYELYVIPDSREGWADSVRWLIAQYEGGGSKPQFDYTQIRGAGAPIRGFGGVSSGPDSLRQLHVRLQGYFEEFLAGKGDRTRLTADVMNAIGVCVVAGNVRRSAEIALGPPDDKTFMELKNYSMNPDRAEIGWMSNNSVMLKDREEFTVLPEIADRIRDNGEPGIVNMINVGKYGRTGERMPDLAEGMNPCGEIPLESYELCNLVEVFPTRCRTTEELYEVMELATLYAQTVSLLRSHRQETNAVVSRNRRIGVSVSGVADWIDQTSVSSVFHILNRGYEDVVVPAARRYARESGVPAPVRVTTVKPSGTVSLLAGVSPGMHFPTAGHVIRRMRMSSASPVADALSAAGVPHEADEVSEGTEVFEFPVKFGNGNTRPVSQVSIFEQAAIVSMLQRSWADNSVSNTITVSPHEMGLVERVLALYAPQVKSLSLLPDTEEGAYAQMPVERIVEGEFDERTERIGEVRWPSEGRAKTETDKYCDSDVCTI